jgi:hypothetical protein
VRRVGVDPNEITHPIFGYEPSNLVGGVTVRINKKTAVALADVFDEKIYEERGLADARHALDVYVLRSVDRKWPVIRVGADKDVHSLKTWSVFGLFTCGSFI